MFRTLFPHFRVREADDRGPLRLAQSIETPHHQGRHSEDNDVWRPLLPAHFFKLLLHCGATDASPAWPDRWSVSRAQWCEEQLSLRILQLDLVRKSRSMLTRGPRTWGTRRWPRSRLYGRPSQCARWSRKRSQKSRRFRSAATSRPSQSSCALGCSAEFRRGLSGSTHRSTAVHRNR